MANPTGYTIHATFERQTSDAGGLVYLALYTIEDDKGVRGQPVTVGTFASAEEAMEAARASGQKVLDQLH